MMAEEETDLRKLVKRIAGTGEFIKHNIARCAGCGKCVKVCPMSIWKLTKGKAVMSSEYKEKCVECGACWTVCPEDAIDFRYPNGGTGVSWEYG